MKNKGITLIALVVTVVVLLILAGISIGALNGENGIIGQAKEGKDSAEVSEEKEIIEVSSVQAMEKDRLGNLEKNNLQEKLDANAGDAKTEVIVSGDKLVVKFIEKNRYYEIDKDGNTEGPKELIKDENAGDLSKGGKADGSEEKPFEINCIEDLVAFSNMTNAGDKFESKYVILNKTLDFKSIFSYNDYTTTKYGDLNTDGIVEDIKTELTKTAEGCVGFTPIGDFDGIFNGQDNWINNIYENAASNDMGLFSRITSNATIKNLKISGNINSNSNWIGGFVGNIIITTNNTRITAK